jgi:hypothetical protein
LEEADQGVSLNFLIRSSRPWSLKVWDVSWAGIEEYFGEKEGGIPFLFHLFEVLSDSPVSASSWEHRGENATALLSKHQS